MPKEPKWMSPDKYIGPKGPSDKASQKSKKGDISSSKKIGTKSIRKKEIKPAFYPSVAKCARHFTHIHIPD